MQKHVEEVEFEGVTYRRYPNSENRTDRVYFTPNGTLRANGAKRLHEAVWVAANGPIPDGWHVHHIDGNPLNNELVNLECLSAGDHARHHHSGPASPAKRAHLDRVRPLAAEWHSSEEGREWHRQNAKNALAKRPGHTVTCEQCGTTFHSTSIRKPRFCGNNCKSAWRRDSGIDDVARECVVCGETFHANRYSKIKTCSRSCGGKAQSRTKTSSP